MTLYQRVTTENNANSENLNTIETCANKAIQALNQEIDTEVTGVNEDGFIQGDFNEQPFGEQERFEELFRENLEEENIL